jgi:hypothetical protein
MNTDDLSAEEVEILLWQTVNEICQGAPNPTLERLCKLHDQCSQREQLMRVAELALMTERNLYARKLRSVHEFCEDQSDGIVSGGQGHPRNHIDPDELLQHVVTLLQRDNGHTHA